MINLAISQITEENAKAVDKEIYENGSHFLKVKNYSMAPLLFYIRVFMKIHRYDIDYYDADYP